MKIRYSKGGLGTRTLYFRAGDFRLTLCLWQMWKRLYIDRITGRGHWLGIAVRVGRIGFLFAWA